MILDAHSHVHDPLATHLSALDDAGVDRTVLFPTRAHPERATDLDSLHLELSTANIVFAVRLAIRELPTRTFFGSDAPYGDPVLARTTVERVTSPGEVRDRVLGGNLAELLSLG